MDQLKARRAHDNYRVILKLKATLIVKPRSTHNATQAEYVRLVALAKAAPEIPPADRSPTEKSSGAPFTSEQT